MAPLSFLIFFVFVLTFGCSRHISIEAAYNLTSNQSIADGESLVSQGGGFKLGFFSPSNSNNRYLGIWFATIPVQTVVWVANRDSPLPDTSGVLKINAAGNIVIVNQTEYVIWSSNSSTAVENPILELLESGNLVLRDVRDKNSENYLWQSFDYPGDTLLSGMKLGRNLKTGMNRYMTSWKTSDNPSHGDFIMEMDPAEYLELIIRNGSRKYFRSGTWNGIRFSGTPFVQPSSLFSVDVVSNSQEIYYIYENHNQSSLVRLVLTQANSEAQLRRISWDDNSNGWVNLVSNPRDRCDMYGICGAQSTCDFTNVAVCQCLKGFRPKSPQEWSASNWSQGCVRATSLNCTVGDGFIKYTAMKLPETKSYRVNTTMNLEECRVRCLKNCSCMAYSNSDIRGDGSGCIMWFSDLNDIGEVNGAGQDLYVRMAASEIETKGSSKKKDNVILIASITSAAGIILFGLVSWCIWKKRTRGGGSKKDDLELPLYSLATIITATNNFSEENKLGEGGFGPVYQGKLEGGLEIAVKRLSKDSMQGDDQFKNEVILIAKLQHRNLVKLLGCCTKGAEKMLVYEYLQNKSLDEYIFDGNKLLDWQKRYEIILGIARGLLYLHHDSRLRIIHRDLKASNVLLDGEMIPKISDFGMARLFTGDQIEAKTKRVVGTYGYMSPEYAFDGYFSVKSDVFAFGVLVLEIISGRKNRGFCDPEHDLNLLGHAWRLWREDRSMELVDEWTEKSCNIADVKRCIHIGLLCVQKHPEKRPTMTSVVLMLSSEATLLPKPEIPGFYMDRAIPSTEISSSSDSTMTLLEAR